MKNIVSTAIALLVCTTSAFAGTNFDNNIQRIEEPTAQAFNLPAVVPVPTPRPDPASLVTNVADSNTIGIYMADDGHYYTCSHILVRNGVKTCAPGSISEPVPEQSSDQNGDELLGPVKNSSKRSSCAVRFGNMCAFWGLSGKADYDD